MEEQWDRILRTVERRHAPRTPVHPTSGFQHKSTGRDHWTESNDRAFKKRVAKRRAKKGYR